MKLDQKGNIGIFIMANLAFFFVLMLMAAGGYGTLFITSIHLTSPVTLFVIFFIEALLFMASGQVR